MGAIKLDGFIESVRRAGLTLNGIVVRQFGQIQAAYDWQPPERRQLYSASKTVTALLAGIAMEEGLFSLTDRVADFFPEIVTENQSQWLRSMTVKNLLTMTTGHAECPLFRRMHGENKPTDYAQVFFDEPIAREPGTYFVYDNAATYMTARIIAKVTGKPMLEYANEKLFHPMGLEDVQWNTCPMGHTLGMIGLHLTTEELSRVAQLLLNRGLWNGRRLVPEAYIKELSTKQIDNAPGAAHPEAAQGYGYFVWMNSYPHSYRMDGMFGQYGVVLPELDAVVAITSAERDQPASNILAHVWSEITPQLEKNIKTE